MQPDITIERSALNRLADLLEQASMVIRAVSQNKLVVPSLIIPKDQEWFWSKE